MPLCRLMLEDHRDFFPASLGQFFHGLASESFGGDYDFEVSPFDLSQFIVE